MDKVSWSGSRVVCFTDPFSLSFHSWPQNKSYPQLLAPESFLWRRGSSRIGAVLVLNGQMSWHIILIFRIILISKRGYRSRLVVERRDWCLGEKSGKRITCFLYQELVEKIVFCRSVVNSFCSLVVPCPMGFRLCPMYICLSSSGEFNSFMIIHTTGIVIEKFPGFKGNMP